jgi:hypothetical protein
MAHSGKCCYAFAKVQKSLESYSLLGEKMKIKGELFGR